MTIKRTAFWAAGIVLLIVSAMAFYWYNKPHAGVEGLTADYTVSASELFNAYQQNETAANAKYLNKVVAVTGLVEAVKPAGNSALLQLNADDVMGGISCNIADKNDEEADAFLNKTITVKGRCTGFLMDVVLVDCVVTADKN